jgi:hypothetical protein
MKTLKIAIGIALLAALAVSCVPKTESMGDAGQTLVRINPASFAMLAVDAKTTAQTGVLFTVRKVVANAAALNVATTAVLTYDTDTAILKAYNAVPAHKANFIPLPSALGTVSPAITAGKITLTFGPGEFSKTIFINMPSSASFDFSKSYALAFRLTEVTGEGVISEGTSTDIVCQVLAKNKYDGKYSMKGFIMRPGDTGGLEGYFKDHAKVLATAGAKSVTMSPNQLWANGGGVGGIGTWTITVNDAGTPPYPITVTDPVAVNWLMDPAYPNRYDPATKTFYFKVNWGATIPYIRGCTDTLVYTGPR